MTHTISEMDRHGSKNNKNAVVEGVAIIVVVVVGRCCIQRCWLEHLKILVLSVTVTVTISMKIWSHGYRHMLIFLLILCLVLLHSVQLAPYYKGLPLNKRFLTGLPFICPLKS